MCFLKLIDKERDFEHLKKISVVDIKSDSQIEACRILKYIGGRKNMLKRASRKLRSTPAKTLMYIILFLVLFLAIFSMLMIGIASGNKVKRAQEKY